MGVYTQAPKKKNRGQKTSLSSVHKYSEENNIPVRFPETLNTQTELEHFRKEKPDIVVVVAYGKILPTEILNLENIIFINIHASLLPKWRGAAPIQRAIMNCDKETGISIMKIVPKLDAGPIYIQSKIKISKETNYEELSNQMSNLGAKLTLEVLDLIENNKANKIFSVVGGGDTVSLLNNLNAIDNFNFVSTAGGAFLEYLEGKKLPGITALN